MIKLSYLNGKKIEFDCWRWHINYFQDLNGVIIYNLIFITRPINSPIRHNNNRFNLQKQRLLSFAKSVSPPAFSINLRKHFLHGMSYDKYFIHSSSLIIPKHRLPKLIRKLQFHLQPSTVFFILQSIMVQALQNLEYFKHLGIFINVDNIFADGDISIRPEGVQDKKAIRCPR